MSDVKIATRDSYGKALLELCQAHEDVVVLDADLAESTKSGVVRKAMPERFYDCGIGRYGNDRSRSVCLELCDVCDRPCV